MRLRLPLILLVCSTIACQAVLGEDPTAQPTRRPSQPTVTPRATATVVPTPRDADPTPAVVRPTLTPFVTTPGGARLCDYVPGVSVPADIPEPIPLPTDLPPATTTPFPVTKVDAETTEQQLAVFEELWDVINEEYLYTDFNGRDWEALGEYYRGMIEEGLSEEDFYWAMDALIYELGDNHSYFESPEQVRESDAQFSGNNDYVGIGVLVESVPDANRGVIVLTFPGGAAEEAGLRAHDAILAVDGEPLLDETGALKDIIRGPVDTQVTLTIQRPGEEPYDYTFTRRRITGSLPITACMVPDTRIGYIFIPGLSDETVPEQVEEALEAFMADGELDGLILDNRQNAGGADSVLEDLLSFFTTGVQGHFINRTDERPLRIRGNEIGNSQTVPLVVLVDTNTASFGEVMSGVMQNSGRAWVMGETTPGNVETMWGYDFDDGSRAWVAHDTFRPLNQENAVWETTGIVPDEIVPSRWDLFTEATDPVLAAAVEWLQAAGE